MNTARALIIACGLALAALIGLMLRPPVVVAVAAPAPTLDVEPGEPQEAPEAEPEPAEVKASVSGFATGSSKGGTAGRTRS